MTFIANTTPAFNDEEDLILNVSKVINDYLTKNTPIDYITKHFFYAKNLICVLAKHDIPFKVTYLGAGVRRITATNQQPTKSPSTTFNPPPQNVQQKIWKDVFGTTQVTANTVAEALPKNPLLISAIFYNCTKLTPIAIGAALAYLEKNVPWLHKSVKHDQAANQRKTVWYAS